MEITKTIDLMLSSDYKERFKAEYFQTKFRYEKLKNMLDKLENGLLEFKPTCPIYILKKQLETMKEYIEILEVRALIEKVELINES